MGNWSIMARKPYPRIFFVMQVMINSCATELTRNVITKALELENRSNEEKYTWRRRKW